MAAFIEIQSPLGATRAAKYALRVETCSSFRMRFSTVFLNFKKAWEVFAFLAQGSPSQFVALFFGLRVFRGLVRVVLCVAGWGGLGRSLVPSGR